jgi:hypothetical protein
MALNKPWHPSNPNNHGTQVTQQTQQTQTTVRGKKAKHSVMELEGLGADIWKGVDAQEYVLKERNSWD